MQRFLIPLGLAFVSSCNGDSYEGPYRHVVLISLDTTRQDHLSCFGDRSKTPRIDELAAEGLRFSHAMATAPTTLAAHTSIMTGSYPHTHGVVRNNFVVDEGNVMLAELLAEQGFHCAGFLGSFALDRRFGFAQGFHFFDERYGIQMTPQEFDQNQRRAVDVTDAALAHVDELGDVDRLFLFAHYFDAHTPYSPPDEWCEGFVREGAPRTSNLMDTGESVLRHQKKISTSPRPYGALLAGGLTTEMIARSDGAPLPGDEDLAALYAAEVAYTDSEVGRLLDGLRERGILEDAIVILVADHGEAFWEHADTFNHGLCVYETTARVPLILRLPGGRGAGQEVLNPVSTVDILATLVPLLELSSPAQLEGVDLLRTLDDGFDRGPVFCEATQPYAPTIESGVAWANARKAKCVRSGNLKLIYTPYLKLLELYDVVADPLEQQDLLRDPTPQIAEDVKRLRDTLESWMRERPVFPSQFTRVQIDETMKRLEELGYTGNNPNK